MGKLSKVIHWQSTVGAILLLMGVVPVIFREDLPRYSYGAGLAGIVIGMLLFVAGIITLILVPEENSDHWK